MALAFIYGSQSQFDEEVKNDTVNPGGLYFINDTQRIYRGAELIVQSGIRFVTEVPETQDMQADTLYVVNTVDPDTNEPRFEIYYFNGEESKQVAGSDGVINKDKLMEALPVFKSVDLDDINEATDDQLITAGAVRNLLSWQYMEG